MSTPNDTDIFLIERSGTQYKLSYEDMSTLNDDDLLLVERSGTQYKIEAQYVSTGPSGYFDAPVTVLTPLNGAGLNAGQSYEPLSSAIVSESSGVITFTDNTELANIVGPVRMVDASGNVKIPQTGTIASVSTVAGDALFAVTLYNGAGAVSTVTTGIDNTAESLIWTKRRNGGGGSHTLVSSATGLGSFVSSNTTDALGSFGTMTVSTTGYTTSGDSYTSASGGAYVSWNFKAAPGFLDIVTYQGDGTLEQKFNHGLQAEPGLVLIKRTNQSRHWCVWHKDASLDGILDSTDDFGYNFIKSVTSTYVETYYQNQAPTNQTGGNYVAYVFGSDDTNIKCGSYTGSGPATITVGFKPAFVMIKSVTSATNWHIYSRDIGNGKYMQANNTSSEVTGGTFNFTNTGFSLSAYDSGLSNSGVTYAYIAIKEGAVSPDTFDLTLNDSTDLQFLKEGDAVTVPNSTTQTAAFSSTTYNGNNNNGQSINTGIDFTGSGGGVVWLKMKSSSSLGSASHYFADTVRGITQYFRADTTVNSTTAPAGKGVIAFLNNGFTLGPDVSGMTNYDLGGTGYVAWNFREAPGFFKMVEYTGNQSSARSIPHDLTTVPGLMIIKDITRGEGWMVYHKDLGANSYSFLDTSWGAAGNDTSMFGGITPTTTNFYVGNSSNTNHNGDKYLAYLFADDGTNIKCGSYTGNGSTKTINCGFQAGWVMIKRSNGTGNWNIFDSSRGLTTSASGDITALFANTDDKGGGRKLSATATGFKITSDASTDVNTPNGQYIFLAIRNGATGGSYGLNGTVEEDANVATKKVRVDFAAGVGSALTGPTLNTVSNTVSSQSGSTLTVTNTTGAWLPGLHAEGATVTRSGPSPTSIVFTSANSGTTAVTGFDATLARRLWTLESASSASGPWSVVGSYQDTAANASQNGATPWGNPTLSANTFYRVKVKYESLNADPVESIYNTFRTGAA